MENVLRLSGVIFFINDVVMLESKPPLKYAATFTSALSLNFTASVKINSKASVIFFCSTHIMMLLVSFSTYPVFITDKQITTQHTKVMGKYSG